MIKIVEPEHWSVIEERFDNVFSQMLADGSVDCEGPRFTDNLQVSVLDCLFFKISSKSSSFKTDCLPGHGLFSRPLSPSLESHNFFLASPSTSLITLGPALALNLFFFSPQLS